VLVAAVLDDQLGHQAHPARRQDHERDAHLDPVRVSGDLADPDVVFLSPTAVGKRILRLFENIIKLPVDIISPILPKGKEQEKEN
jgi:hypothetical protein